MADVDSNKLASRTKTVHSCALHELYMHIKGVQASEPGKRGGRIQEHTEKPCPMGERDGLSFFIQSCPIEDTLSLSLLEHESRKKRKRVGESYDSGET